MAEGNDWVRELAEKLARQFGDQLLEALQPHIEAVSIRDEMRSSGWYTEEQIRELVPLAYA